MIYKTLVMGLRFLLLVHLDSCSSLKGVGKKWMCVTQCFLHFGIHNPHRTIAWMMQSQAMHHLLCVPGTGRKAAFLSNPFTCSGWRGLAAWGKTPSSSVTCTNVCCMLCKSYSQAFKVHPCHPSYICFFRSKAAAVAVLCENGENIRFALHLFIWLVGFNSSCPSHFPFQFFPFPSWLWLAQQGEQQPCYCGWKM